MEQNYENLVKFISDSSGVDVEEVERKVAAKQEKLAGLISREGAAQVIAAELNVNFEKQVVKIGQLVPGMKKVNVVGKVIELYPVREFNKNGRSGRVASMVVADESSNVRLVMWDENHIELVGKEIVKNCVLEVGNASVRNGEIHLTGFSEVKVSDRVIENIIVEKPTLEKKVFEFGANDSISCRAFIVQIFEPRFFYVCPECRKKVVDNNCESHGSVIGVKRALLNIVVDDGSDNIRSVMFSDVLEKVIGKEVDNYEFFSSRKEDLLGKEMRVSGKVRRNSLYGNNEFIIEDMEEVDLDKLIGDLES